VTELELRALAQLIADVLVERGLVGLPQDLPRRLLDAAVAQLLDPERQWVGTPDGSRSGFASAPTQQHELDRVVGRVAENFEPHTGRDFDGGDLDDCSAGSDL
jgi:hypothetical protein